MTPPPSYYVMIILVMVITKFLSMFDALGIATAIHIWWDEEIEPEVTKEDKHAGII